MKKLCVLLFLVLLLSGCGKESNPAVSGSGGETAQNPWVSIDIYAINDLHGRILETESQPGVGGLSTYLKQKENAIVLSTGDMWQGTSESNLTEGLIVTEWMNEMGMTAMTVGGHEYDWGEEGIDKNAQLAQFPFLGINIFNRQTDKRAAYCEGSVVVERDGVQVGIIGAAGDYSSSIDGEKTKDLYFKTGQELTELVKEESERLRSEGVDFIIYAIHDGAEQISSAPIPAEQKDLEAYYDPVLSDGYVDLVFEADTHYSYVLVDGYGVYHLQAGGNNSGLSHARVLINRKSGEISVAAAEVIPSGKYRPLEAHPVMEKLQEIYGEKIAPARKVLGINSRYRSGKEICQLVADLYCSIGEETWGERYDIVLAGGYISCRSPGYLNQGQVTYGQLQSLLPYDNQISICSIRGNDLIRKFLETDNSAYYIRLTDFGKSIRNSIDPDGIYYVVTDSYTANYAYNNMTVIAELSGNIYARDLVAQYVSEGEF